MLTKSVNGQEIVCSAEEEAAIRAEWVANDPTKRAPIAPKPTLDDIVAVLTVEQKAALAARIERRAALIRTPA